jgi:hypothetical protein
LIDTLVNSGKVLAGAGAAAIAMPPAPVHASLVVEVVTYALPFVMSFLSHLILHLFTKNSNGPDQNSQNTQTP